MRAAATWASARRDPELAAALVRPVATELTLRARQEIGDFAEQVLAITPVEGTAARAFWLVWVAERLVQSGNQGAYERVVERHGEPDHPLAHYVRAYASGDGEALARCLPAAAAALEAGGDDQLARFIELTSARTLVAPAARAVEANVAPHERPEPAHRCDDRHALASMRAILAEVGWTGCAVTSIG